MGRLSLIGFSVFSVAADHTEYNSRKRNVISKHGNNSLNKKHYRDWITCVFLL